MKKLSALLLCACLLFSCARAGILQDMLHHFRHDTVIVEGTSYTSGFYGELYPQLSSSGNVFELNGESFYRLDHPQFDLICRDQTGIDALLCAEDQWQAASDYYGNDANFSYYCRIGAQYADRAPILVPLPDMDASIFNALMSFADENEYNPFGQNRTGECLRLPMPDRDTSPQLVFYKESCDKLFSSYQGHKFHIVDGSLLMVYYYDSNQGAEEELVAVKVPDEFAQHFIFLL